MRDICHRPPVHTSVYCLIVDPFRSFCLWRHSSSSWAHHSGAVAAPASTFADILYLITAAGWLDYRRHWLKYLENFLLETNGQRGHAVHIQRTHEHQQGERGSPQWNDLLKVKVQTKTVKTHLQPPRWVTVIWLSHLCAALMWLSKCSTISSSTAKCSIMVL